MVEGLGARIKGMFLVRVIERYTDADAGTWAQVIAWNSLTAFLPMVLVTVTVLGLLLRNPDLAHSLELRVAQAVGNGGSKEALLGALTTFRQRTGLFAGLSFAGLVWSATTLIGAFERALASLYRCKMRSFIAARLVGIAVMALFIAFAVALVLINSLFSWLQNVPDVPAFIHSGTAEVIIQGAGGILVSTILFGVIYYVVPNRKQRVRNVFPGACLAGLMLEAITLLWPLYFNATNGFGTFGKTFGLLFLLIAYFFLLGQTLVVGAVINAELELGESFKSGPRPITSTN